MSDVMRAVGIIPAGRAYVRVRVSAGPTSGGERAGARGSHLLLAGLLSRYYPSQPLPASPLFPRLQISFVQLS